VTKAKSSVTAVHSPHFIVPDGYMTLLWQTLFRQPATAKTDNLGRSFTDCQSTN